MGHTGKLLATCSALVLTAGATTAGADGKGETSFDFANLTIGSDRSKIEAEAKWDSDGASDFNGLLVGIKVKAPAGEAEGSTRARLDEYTADWRVGFVVGKQFSDDGGDWKLLTRVDAEVGTQRYKHFPDAGTASVAQRETSFGMNASVVYWRWIHGDVAPQLKARFASDWEAAKGVGIVTPGMAGEPDTVTSEKVVSPPLVAPALFVRASLFVRPGGGQFAVGPSVAYLRSGEGGDDEWDVNSGDRIIRSEAWIYLLPGSGQPANTRFGVAPFVDHYTKGNAPDDTDRELGVLFQVRWGAPNYAY